MPFWCWRMRKHKRIYNAVSLVRFFSVPSLDPNFQFILRGSQKGNTVLWACTWKRKSFNKSLTLSDEIYFSLPPPHPIWPDLLMSCFLAPKTGFLLLELCPELLQGPLIFHFGGLWEVTVICSVVHNLHIRISEMSECQIVRGIGRFPWETWKNWPSPQSNPGPLKWLRAAILSGELLGYHAGLGMVRGFIKH